MLVTRNNSNLSGSVKLPASKSLSNRALIIRALCDKDFEIQNLSNADDTKILGRAIAHLRTEKRIDCGDGGTVLRFLTAFLCTLEEKEFHLYGSEQLQSRPISPLVEALKSIGADIEYLEDSMTAPLKIKGKQLRSNLVNMRSQLSSQFISALCMIAPALDDGISLSVEGKIFSQTYIEMTLKLMEYFGIKSYFKDGHIDILKNKYVAKDYKVESDWSSACFFYAMAILSDDAEIKIEGLGLKSLQGDSKIAELCEDLGIETLEMKDGILISKKKNIQAVKKLIDLSNYPDLAIALIVACAVKHPEITFSGLDTLKYKESNRIEALKTGLNRIGIELKEQYGNISFEGRAKLKQENVNINTFDDHRIAMAFSLLAVCGYSIRINNPDCVSKSFPLFYEQLQALNFIIS